MPALNLNCDIKQGFEFGKDASATVGYLTSLSVGGVALAVDQTTLRDPAEPANAIPAVAVLSGVDWDGAPTDPITFTGQLSEENARQLATRLGAAPATLAVSVEFAVYEYDFLAEKMFASGRSTGPLHGDVARTDGEFALHVATSPAPVPHQSRTFPFEMVIVPTGPAQVIQLATSPTVRSTSPWGAR